MPVPMALFQLLMVGCWAGGARYVPDGLVGNDDLGPLLLGELLGGGVELAGYDFDGLVCFTFLRRVRL